jgi:hypothetical protein
MRSAPIAPPVAPPIAPISLRRLARCGVAGAAAVMLLLASAWFMGWQRDLGRLDPALVIPWLLPLLLWLAWCGRGWHVRARLAGAAAVLLLLLGAQAIAILLWADASVAVVVPQLAGVALAYVVGWAVSAMVLHWLRGPLLLVLAAFSLLSLMWMVAAHGILSWAYSPASARAGAAPVVMMTSLPLRWAGSDDFADIFSGRTRDDVFLQKLEALGPVSLVDSLDGLPLSGAGTVFLAHPHAMTPQDMVAVDAHVRRGGRALILADALSSWPAVHPLGDRRNPPITSLLTPLLDHWGVSLNAAAHGEGGAAWFGGRDRGLWLHSSGRFGAWPSNCQMIGDSRALTCRIGRGNAVILGDADLLYAPMWQADGWDAAHLMRSDVIYWTVQQLWGRDAGRRLLQPIWMKAEYRRPADPDHGHP